MESESYVAHKDRFAIAARPENQGESFVVGDYVTLAVVTLLLPLLMIVAAWFA